MLGTAFEIARETDGGFSLGLWGRVARSGLSGREEGMDFDGDVTSAMLGTDWTRRDALFGLMLFRRRGEGGYFSRGRTLRHWSHQEPLDPARRLIFKIASRPGSWICSSIPSNSRSSRVRSSGSVRVASCSTRLR